MALANISIPGGVSVEVNGTPEEIANVLQTLKAQHSTFLRQDALPPRRGKGEIPTLIDALKSENFFRAPKSLAQVQRKLAELGHHYPVTTLSGAMQAQTKSRNLRRFKEDGRGRYVYVQ